MCLLAAAEHPDGELGESVIFEWPAIPEKAFLDALRRIKVMDASHWPPLESISAIALTNHFKHHYPVPGSLKLDGKGKVEWVDLENSAHRYITTESEVVYVVVGTAPPGKSAE